MDQQPSQFLIHTYTIADQFGTTDTTASLGGGLSLASPRCCCLRQAATPSGAYNVDTTTAVLVATPSLYAPDPFVKFWIPNFASFK